MDYSKKLRGKRLRRGAWWGWQEFAWPPNVMPVLVPYNRRGPVARRPFPLRLV